MSDQTIAVNVAVPATESTFAKVLAERLSRHPTLKALSAETIALLAKNFDTWREIHTHGAEALVDEEFGVDEKQARALVNVANTEATTIESAARQGNNSGENLTVVVATEMSAAETNGQQDNVYGQWDSQRNAGAGTGGTLNLAAALAANINAPHVLQFGEAAMAFALDAGGVDKAVLQIAARRQAGTGAKIKDPSARSALFDYRRKKDRGYLEFLNMSERQNAWATIGKILDERFEGILAAAARFHGSRDEAAGMGDQARISVGTGQYTLGQTRGMLPLIAEQISNRMVAGELGEESTMVVNEYHTVMEILRSPAIQVASGVMPNVTNPTLSALEVLDNEGFQEAANFMRLGMAYEELMRRLSLCPSKPDNAYVLFVGEAASEVVIYGALLNVQGTSGVASETPFRTEPVSVAPATSQQQVSTKREWKFDFRLQLTISRS